jgi:hypothetical protein
MEKIQIALEVIAHEIAIALEPVFAALADVARQMNENADNESGYTAATYTQWPRDEDESE